jgi:alanine-glyoxylate transaminase/serine-glyoxylate transaminase/serine-pyruvate transaminase
LNTPFSTERTARVEDEQGNRIPPKKFEAFKKEAKKEPKKDVEEVKKLAPEPPKKMSSQAPHPALLIPGPIEFDDAVLSSMSHYR